MHSFHDVHSIPRVGKDEFRAMNKLSIERNIWENFGGWSPCSWLPDHPRRLIVELENTGVLTCRRQLSRSRLDIAVREWVQHTVSRYDYPLYESTWHKDFGLRNALSEATRVPMYAPEVMHLKVGFNLTFPCSSTHHAYYHCSA